MLIVKTRNNTFLMLCDLDFSILHFCGANEEEAIEMQHPTLVNPLQLENSISSSLIAWFVGRTSTANLSRWKNVEPPLGY